MTNPVQLTTERLHLRALQMSDAPRLQAIASDPQVALTTASIPHPYPADGAISFIEGARDMADANRGKFAITLRDTGLLIGLVGFSGAGTAAELTYMIAPSHWRRGFATEAAGAVIDHLVHQQKFHAVVARAMAINPASMKVLQKLGFIKQWEETMEIPLRGGRYLIAGWRLDASTIALRD